MKQFLYSTTLGEMTCLHLQKKIKCLNHSGIVVQQIKV